MNTNPGLLGTKLGNTQIFTDAGEIRRVTAIQAGPCVVLGKRTVEQNGYSALQLAFGEKREKLVNKPEAGVFAKAGQKPARVVKEIRLPADVVAKYNVGDAIKPTDLFAEGQLVDVTGTSKGKGFQGVMKRHNMAGSISETHGVHEYRRHGGSIGMRKTPGRTFKGHRMAGQMGNVRVTNQALRVVKVLAEENIVLVEGSVPGGKNGLVVIRGSVKKRGVAA
ncbi:MAG: 50S ribosomal protein L3 [Candidatus Eisenbacteria bacterium]|nr:50S ribosomal protein L3 [Candidatus Eisenbacteria bacterium]